MVALPRMRVLGYAQTRPHLRLLTLPDETVAPSPVPLNGANAALDRAWMRDGWVAFNPNEEVWGVPLPLVGKAFKIGRWWRCVPSVNARCVWLGGPINPDPDADPDRDPSEPTIVAEYDGVNRAVVRELRLPPGSWLEGAVPAGVLVSSDEGHRLSVWEPEAGSDRELSRGGVHELLATHETRIAMHRDQDLILLDAATGAEVLVQQPVPGNWDTGASFAPDGRQLAIVLTDHKVSRLVLVDVAGGTTTVAAGTFENFAYPPVWTPDGRWLLFDAPFDKSLFACDTDAKAPQLHPFLRRRGRLAPLVDVTLAAG